MNHPTDGRSIITSLVRGILVICVCGSPAEVSGLQPPEVLGQEDSSTAEEAPAGARFVPVRDVEELDGLTRLIWTAQMIFVPDALAHVNPLYAYDPEELVDRTVYPDRIGAVATVGTCRTTDNGIVWISPLGETIEQDYDSRRQYSASHPDGREPTYREAWDSRADGFWCANYMSDTIEAFHSAYELMSATPRPKEGTTPGEVYFGTTYPIPGITPKKRFVAEWPR